MTKIIDVNEAGYFKYDYDVNDNCIYKGYNSQVNPGDDEINWMITRYWYDADGNCEKKRTRKISWSNRTVGW